MISRSFFLSNRLGNEMNCLVSFTTSYIDQCHRAKTLMLNMACKFAFKESIATPLASYCRAAPFNVAYTSLVQPTRLSKQ